jgi:hypothetical protein
VALFQGEIMCDAENPAAKVSAGFSKLQVPQKREEHFLGDLLPIMHR